jgi:signal transduction histidine kinase
MQRSIRWQPFFRRIDDGGGEHDGSERPDRSDHVYCTDGGQPLTRPRERLRCLQEITQKLMVATTEAEIASQALTAATDALQLPYSSIWRYDASADVLRLLEQTADAEAMFSGDHPERFARGEGLAWSVFEEQEVRVYDDLSKHEETYNPDTPLRSELIAPAGEQALIIAASTTPSTFDDFDVDMTRILAATVESAFDRLDRERKLRTHQRDLTLLKELLSRILRHNLRNELSRVRGYAEVIAIEADERFQRMAEKIIDASADLVATSEKARFVERLVDADLEMTEVHLSTLVDRSLDSIAVPDRVTIERDLPTDVTVAAIPQISCAIENLVENAIVHAGDAPTVELTASVDESGSWVDLIVADDGPGIPPVEIDVIRSNEESALRHGSGMGLWLVDWVVTKSNGDLHFETDDGTRAVVCLPTSTSSAV